VICGRDVPLGEVDEPSRDRSGIEMSSAVASARDLDSAAQRVTRYLHAAVRGLRRLSRGCYAVSSTVRAQPCFRIRSGPKSPHRRRTRGRNGCRSVRQTELIDRHTCLKGMPARGLLRGRLPRGRANTKSHSRDNCRNFRGAFCDANTTFAASVQMDVRERASRCRADVRPSSVFGGAAGNRRSQWVLSTTPHLLRSHLVRNIETERERLI